MSTSQHLYVTDSRTGKRHEIPIDNNAIRASDLANIQDLGGQAPKALRVVDDGLQSIAIGSSHITRLDAEKGCLYYRGYNITSIFGEKSYEEVCYCLIWGDFPSPAEAALFRHGLAVSTDRPPQLLLDVIQKFPRDAPAATMFQAGLSAMLAIQSSTIPAFVGKDMYSRNMEIVDSSITRTLVTARMIFATVYCHRQGCALAQPDPDGSFCYNLLLMMGLVEQKTQKPNPKYVVWIEKILLIYADHEMSCGTFAFITAASARSDPLSCYLAAVTTLYGIIHGGAVDAAYLMLQRVSCLENVPSLMAAARRREELLYGFGHRIYTTRDPRAQLLLEVLKEVQAETKSFDPLFEVAEEVDRLASQDPFFQERGIGINADFYTNFVCTGMGLPQDMVFLIIALSRLQGFLAHWREFLAQRPRIIRPTQVYVGEIGRRVHKL